MCSPASAQFFGIVPHGLPERCHSVCLTAPTPRTAPNCAALEESAKKSWEETQAVSWRPRPRPDPEKGPHLPGGRRGGERRGGVWRDGQIHLSGPSARPGPKSLWGSRKGCAHLQGTSIPAEIPGWEYFLDWVGHAFSRTTGLSGRWGKERKGIS